MFKKILIANRGEIACRVIRSAKHLGIQTVAVYSEADRFALHRRLADESVFIGPSPSAESYLVIDHIIDACQQTGAEAVHPGYGFLSENAEFCRRLDEAGIVFIGPKTHAIQAMGDKLTSKQIAAKAGVNTIPGYNGIITDSNHAVEVAQGIGYPVMLKASAGGGGKGMRIARNDAECREGFERASSEARSSFGDDRLLIEKYIEQPRHIEIQLLADKTGHCIYLNERECSIQRRHQKVIEEAPSPLLDEATRQAMGEQAIALAQAVDYQSAGTVEFVADAQRNFYFLEMNTRLQVEHPISEMITGIDLVAWMIRIAAGEALTLQQQDIGIDGWALECRLYAEDPTRGFLPSTGRLVNYQPPEASGQIRIDSGMAEGSEVSMYYDPMIGKLISHGANRDLAISAMVQALDQFTIRGIAHNLRFLSALLQQPRFQQGQLTTNFINETFIDGFDDSELDDKHRLVLLAAAGLLHQRRVERHRQIDGQMPGLTRKVPNRWVVYLNQQPHPVQISTADGGYHITYNHQTYRLTSSWGFGDKLLQGQLDGESVAVQVDCHLLDYTLSTGRAQVNARVLSEAAAQLQPLMPVPQADDNQHLLRSPMPGLLLQLSVKAGDRISAGGVLAVVEAMKMENILHAERDVVVDECLAQVGDSLVVDQLIMRFVQDDS